MRSTAEVDKYLTTKSVLVVRSTAEVDKYLTTKSVQWVKHCVWALGCFLVDGLTFKTELCSFDLLHESREATRIATNVFVLLTCFNPQKISSRFVSNFYFQTYM